MSSATSRRGRRSSRGFVQTGKGRRRCGPCAARPMAVARCVGADAVAGRGAVAAGVGLPPFQGSALY
eukprot:1571766-Pyramimonas_sp.AAC.1